ncbi:MAG: 2-(5''-triphosphoribosyl)-3'-dephosphocoenzyme-A synthase [Candidatus Celerinatantimonas neptuna]|nr:MAG: 2-(5''-triphosphoribosyl)-3'-dephosphocoenzyme-A synthase [Candidatus Celerinatantimonas neptuna]
MFTGLKQLEALENEVFEPQVQSCFAQIAAQSLRTEVRLTPKPGLVDEANNGAHHDMDLALFETSIQAISPWFDRFIEIGRRSAKLAAPVSLFKARPCGLACERAMFDATGQINTHKGAIFALSLLCLAYGRLWKQLPDITPTKLTDQVAQMTAQLVSDELQHCTKPMSAGQQLFQEFGLLGARGEAASGFETVHCYALPIWNLAMAKGYSQRQALLRVLISLMAHNPDTNIVSRGGIHALNFVQKRATQILQHIWDDDDQFINQLQQLDIEMIRHHLSPGGSADLLSVTWLLSRFPQPSITHPSENSSKPIC